MAKLATSSIRINRLNCINITSAKLGCFQWDTLIVRVENIDVLICPIFCERSNWVDPRGFCKRRVLVCTLIRSMGGENPLTIHEISAALTPSDSRSDWASESAAVSYCCRETGRGL